MRITSSHDLMSYDSKLNNQTKTQHLGGDTKVMKKSLSLLVAIAMVFSMFASVASAEEKTTEDKFYELKELGIFDGYLDGLPHLEDNMTREQAAKIIALVFGLDIDESAESTFSDVTSDRWSTKYIEASVKVGIIEGMGDGTFAPTSNVTIEEFAKMLAVGYADLTNVELDEEATVDNENISEWAQHYIAAALDLGLIAEYEDYTIDADRTFLVDSAYTTYESVEAFKAVPQIKSVTALNLVTVEVEFTNVNGLEKSDLEDESNYELTDSDDNKLAIDTVSLDGTTLTMTLAKAAPNQETATLTVDAGLLGTEEDVVIENIKFFDAEIPVAEEIELIGPNKFRVHFSEPMNPEITGHEVEVEDGVYGVLGYTFNGKTVTVELSVDSLNEDDYKVVVKGFEDYAGFKALDKTFTLKYVKVDSVPTAEVKNATQTSVEIQFNRPLDVDVEEDFEEYFYHTFSSYNPQEVTSSDNQTFVLDFTNNPLPEGSVKVVVDVDANDEVLADEWGNEIVDNIVFFVDINADKTKPVVNKVEAGSDETIVLVYFSEDVTKESAKDKNNYEVKDADGEVVDIDDIEYTNTNNEYVAELTFDDELSGKYTVKIQDIEDKALETNTLETVTVDFTVKDVSGIDLAATEVVGVDTEGEGEKDYIYLTFPEKMATSGTYSVLDKDNYLLDGEQLSSNDKVELFGNSSKVKITIADNSKVITDSKIIIGRVADISGNTSKLLSTELPIDADEAPEVHLVKTIDEKTIEITVNKALKTVSRTGFEITKGENNKDTLAAVSYEVKGNETIITGTLKAAQQLTNSGDVDFTVTVVADKIMSETGNYMAAGDVSPEDIKDGFAPSLVDNGITQKDVENAKVVIVDFTEAIVVQDEQLSLASTDLVIINASKEQLTAGIDYTVAVNADGNLEITLSNNEYADELEISTIEKVNYIADGSGNVIESFDKEITLQ
ncbi:S-layer homology domain-containing protein [Chengkuizengella sp. SCS-71B]|uniref:S-layer homology domain-containing protein n=1 Tax=Chengkuizengella sp. SCS-71B TaxID=3115290 RepID=UPI0032C21376